MPNIIINRRLLFNRNSGFSYPLTNAFKASTGITDTVIIDSLKQFEYGLFLNGLTNKPFAYWPMVGGDTSTHKFNFMDARDLDAAYRLQFNGGWTHSATGALPNGINAFARTYYIPSAPDLNSLSLGYYSRTNSNAVEVEMGCTDTLAQTFLEIRTGGSTYNAVNNLSGFSFGDADSLGLYITSRSSVNSIKIYKNGLEKASDTTASISSPNREIYLGAYNNNGVDSFYTTKECASAFISSGLTGSEAIVLSGLINTLQTALGRNVY